MARRSYHLNYQHTYSLVKKGQVRLPALPSKAPRLGVWSAVHRYRPVSAIPSAGVRNIFGDTSSQSHTTCRFTPLPVMNFSMSASHRPDPLGCHDRNARYPPLRLCAICEGLIRSGTIKLFDIAFYQCPARRYVTKTDGATKGKDLHLCFSINQFVR